MRRVCILFACLMLTGCSLATPEGTVSINFDKDAKSSQTVFTDDDGKETVIDLSSAKKYVDQLLESVDIPNGGSTDDLKKFVYDSLSSAGIDLDKIDLDDKQEVKDAEKAIKKALKKKGVDTKDIDIDLKEIMK